MNGNDGCTTMWRYLMLPNCTPNNGEKGKLYVMYNLPQKTNNTFKKLPHLKYTK